MDIFLRVFCVFFSLFFLFFLPFYAFSKETTLAGNHRGVTEGGGGVAGSWDGGPGGWVGVGVWGGGGTFVPVWLSTVHVLIKSAYVTILSEYQKVLYNTGGIPKRL